jgi:CRP-like cAMP-binding protein
MIDFTGSSRFLAGFEPSDRRAILAAGRPRHFVTGAVMARQSEPAMDVSLITKGRTRHFYTTPDGRRIILRWLGPGELIGAAALLSESSPYRASTEAVSHVDVVTWKRAAARELVERYPKLLDNALLVGADYVDWHIAAHVALTSLTAEQRLAGVLVSLAPLLGHPVRDGVEIDIKNEELANAANMTIFTASRLINEWQRRGTVIKRRGKVVLIDPHGLFARSA